MRKFLLSFMVGATMVMAQQTEEVAIDMEPGYAKEVYYKFSDQSMKRYDKSSWDIAFYRVSRFRYGVRVNEGKALEVFEVSSDKNDWGDIDIQNKSNWTQLYNSKKTWKVGAFDKGSASQGWGDYDLGDHHIYGSVIFVIKNGGDYYKFMIPEYYGGYKIRYAKWNSDSKSWGEDVTAEIPNSENPNKYFNFFDLESKSMVDAQPDANQWDIVFTQYIDDYTSNDGSVTMKYHLMGVLQSPTVQVAQVEETTPTTNTASLTYSSDIDVIGYDWKILNGFAYLLAKDRVYYVKTSDNQVYRMWFTEFTKTSIGKLKFKQTDTGQLSTVDADGNVSFGVYPNPVTDNRVTIVYDNKQDVASSAQVEIYNMAGQKVFATELSSSKGFYQREVNLGSLAKGVYILKFIYGGKAESKKLIVK